MSIHRLATAAAEYLSAGLAVIALNGKTPNGQLHKHGLHDALRGAPESIEDYALIERFFTHPNTTGVGILTEYPYVVVDIDGEEGAVQWQEILGDVEPDIGPVARTPRLPEGGLHIWFAVATPTGSIKLGPKLDLKGDGGYVVAPPSAHPDGGTYEWLTAWGPIGWVPDPLEVLIEDHNFDLQAKLAAKEVRRMAWGPRWKEGDHQFYAQPGHDSLIEGMKTAAEGNRNAYLHWAAATLSEENGADDEFEQLAEAALAVGLTREETKRTIRSARRANG